MSILKKKTMYIPSTNARSAFGEERGEIFVHFEKENNVYTFYKRAVRLQKKEKRFLSHFENKKTIDLSSTNARSAFVEDKSIVFPHLHRRWRCGKTTSILEGEIEK